MNKIHPTAVLDKGAKIGQNVTIGPFVVIDSSNVVLEDGVHIKAHAYISGSTTIGRSSVIWPFASIGADTQDLKFKGEETFVKIGQRVHIREYVTVNGSCGEGTSVEIGDDCLIMAYCHIAHNCVVGKGVIMANGATLAGHVEIGDYAILGGSSLFHQFVRVGSFAMVGGASRVLYDFPPFLIGGGEPFKYGGLNRVGLSRHKFTQEEKASLTKAFRYTYRSNLSINEALAEIQEHVPMNKRVLEWLDFCKNSKRGLHIPVKLKSERKEQVCP